MFGKVTARSGRGLKGQRLKRVNVLKEQRPQRGVGTLRGVTLRPRGLGEWGRDSGWSHRPAVMPRPPLMTSRSGDDVTTPSNIPFGEGGRGKGEWGH